MMKIVTYILTAVLVVTLAAAAGFYLYMFKPMETDYKRMTAGMPELEKAKAELKKYKEKESQQAKEAAWINPALELLAVGLANEIKAGKAEAVSAGNMIVINMAEDVLYTPETKTFAKDTQTRLKLTGLLKNDGFKGKDILIGNTTEAVPAHGKGRKKIPAKDALALASERSAELVKSLVKDGVPQESLAAVAYSVKLPDRGFKIKNKKTMIIIGACPAPAAATAVAKEMEPAQPKPAAAPAAPSVSQAQPKPIPIKPAQPKPN